MNLWFLLIKGFWIIIPAYAANGLAPLPRGKKRMDFGKKFMGNDLLGKGKTWEGLIFAVLIGTVCGLIEIYAYPYLNPIALKNGFSLQGLTVWSVFFVALGAMLGDTIGSFIKRRLNMKSGESAPLLDQVDFLVGGFFAAMFFYSVPMGSIILLFVITPIIHYTACFLGYQIGIKEVPW